MAQQKNQSRLQDEIDSNLKRAYNDVLNEDIPDRFTELLSKLKQQDASKKGDKGDEHDD